MDIEITEQPVPITSANYYKTQKFKALNILRTQKESIVYNPNIGIDLKFFFLDENIDFQLSSFKSYCVQELVQQSVNVQSILTNEKNIFESYFNIYIGED
jgi:hypothetical protein